MLYQAPYPLDPTKPVPLRVMERASVVGFMLVIGLFLIGFTNDIGQLSGQGFSPR